MMASINEVRWYASSIQGWFSIENMDKLYERALESRGVLVEIGVHNGRSASVLMLAARHTGATVVLVDYWPSNVETVFARLRTDFPDVNLVMVNMCSADIGKVFFADISLIHIDGDHMTPHPEQDCATWLSKVKPGGIACFHDYVGNYEAVKPAVDKHTAGWQDLGIWDSLAIRRKP